MWLRRLAETPTETNPPASDCLKGLADGLAASQAHPSHGAAIVSGKEEFGKGPKKTPGPDFSWSMMGDRFFGRGTW
jgi:hypothetical protein